MCFGLFMHLGPARGDHTQVRYLCSPFKVDHPRFSQILANPTIKRHMNVSMLLSWLSARQYAPEGGFSGRTNKLVDGCYSHWVGGCWPLLQSALDGVQSATAPNEASSGNLYSREGLTRYILGCCQAKEGLRDKPGK